MGKADDERTTQRQLTGAQNELTAWRRPGAQACYERLKFLRTLDREFPAELDLHLILDNYGTHTHESVNDWLAKHPRFHLHFIPTSSSWLNMVERWFREITNKRIRRGVFHSVPDLIAAIGEYLAAYNQDAKPFVWTAEIDKIMEKIARARAALETAN